MSLPIVKHMPPYMPPRGYRDGAVIVDGNELEATDGKNAVAIWHETLKPVCVPRTPYEVYIDDGGNEVCAVVSTNVNPAEFNDRYEKAEKARWSRAGWRSLESFITDGRDLMRVAREGASAEDEAEIAKFKATCRERLEKRNAKMARKIPDIAKGIGEKVAEATTASLGKLGHEIAGAIGRQIAAARVESEALEKADGGSRKRA